MNILVLIALFLIQAPIVNEEIKTEHLTVALSQTQVTAHPGDRITLIADITLPPKMHIYAPGVKGYITTAFNLDPNPAVTIHVAQFPKSQVLLLPAIKQRVPVFQGRTRITRDVTVVNPSKVSQIDLTGMFIYQACDDEICYSPKKVPISFSLTVEGGTKKPR